MKPEDLTADRFWLEMVRTIARYETLRLVTPRQFSELYMRNLQGENFDDMVDELTRQMAKE